MTNDLSDRATLWNSISKLIEKIISEGTGYDMLINVLSLFCLLSILQRNNISLAAPSQQPSGGGLQKLIGELTKGEGGSPSTDTLMSLLPMLNSPQVKSKLNPATLAAVFSLLNNVGAGGEKQEPVKQEPPKVEKKEKNELSHPPLAATEPEFENVSPIDSEKKGAGRYLNWKSSF